MPARKIPTSTFAVTTAVVAMLDLTAKELAGLFLSGRDPITLGGPLMLSLVQNRASAFGISLGRFTWEINALATFAALVMAMVIVPALARIDRRAPIALGLIAGAALGNLTSLILPPAGVPDFLALRLGADRGLVMNLADVAAYAGLLMMMRSALLVSRAMRERRVPRRTVIGEIEVPIRVAVEGPVRGRAPERRPAAVPVVRLEEGREIGG